MQFLAAGGIDAVSAVRLEVLHQTLDGQCPPLGVVIIVVEHLDERPLRPLVIMRVAGAHLPAPVEAEAYLVQLFAIAGDVPRRGDGRVLPRLDGILLGGQTVGIIAHRVEHVEPAKTLVACIYIRSYVAEGVSHVQSRPRRIGKHVEDIELPARPVFGHLVCLVLDPTLSPLLFYLPEVIFHIRYSLSVRMQM